MMRRITEEFAAQLKKNQRRFPKGVSGNPAGRPARRLSINIEVNPTQLNLRLLARLGYHPEPTLIKRCYRYPERLGYWKRRLERNR